MSFSFGGSEPERLGYRIEEWLKQERETLSSMHRYFVPAWMDFHLRGGTAAHLPLLGLTLSEGDCNRISSRRSASKTFPRHPSAKELANLATPTKVAGLLPPVRPASKPWTSIRIQDLPNYFAAEEATAIGSMLQSCYWMQAWRNAGGLQPVKAGVKLTES